MKTIPLTLLNRIKRRTTSLCFCIKIKCQDGDVFGFTNLDASLVVADEDGPLRYSAKEELAPQNIQSQSNFDVDNTDLLGWFDATMEKMVISGKLSGAEMTIYRADYLVPGAGVEVVAFGKIGDVDLTKNNKGRRKVEFRSLMQQLKQRILDSYSLLCRADFGDHKCKMPFVWEAGTVSAVSDAIMKFQISGVVRPVGYFDFGVIEFTSGDNVGGTIEVETWQADGSVVLSFVTRYPVAVGDTLRIRRDCGKTATDCIAYGNIINMRAEHLTPVENASIMVPGAYVQSVGAQ